MAAQNNHSSRVPSIPTTLAEAHARICQLERDSLRLRSIIHGIENQTRALEPGKYILTDEADFHGPFSGDIARMVKDYTSEGDACTVIEVLARHEPDAQGDDFGVTPGIDYPGTLSRVAGW